MGNTQGPQKRDRFDSGNRKSALFADDDQHPFELKIAKSSPSASTHSMQYMNTNEYPVVLKWNTPAKTVAVAGSWDGWKRRIPMVKSKEDFTTIINLPEGRHEFKFLVDTSWTCDTSLPKHINLTGVENNVIEVNREDFDVSDALDKDLQATMTKANNNGFSVPSSDQPAQASTPVFGLGSTIGGEQEKFCQDVPGKEMFDKSSRPPVLPPHLLQVILNKDTPVSCDPNVLPEPNHVMLNHLYALSIKDGVMVLSATHRYRKKYVTTLLYKPI